MVLLGRDYIGIFNSSNLHGWQPTCRGFFIVCYPRLPALCYSSNFYFGHLPPIFCYCFLFSAAFPAMVMGGEPRVPVHLLLSRALFTQGVSEIQAMMGKSRTQTMSLGNLFTSVC